MRNNQPVTGVEVPLADDVIIVSKTNLKGEITYINQDFLDISGFTEVELLGQPHNIVRHPDMPEAAFADMWKSLKAGEPWVGLVKNRCKNGDHYWVEAHVTPLFEQGQVLGYLSVRRKPGREAVAAAEAAYALFREGRQGRRRIVKGRVVSGRGGSFFRLSVKGKLLLLSGIMLSILVVQALLGVYNLDRMHQSAVSMYEGRAVPVMHLGQVRTAMENARAQVMLALQHAPGNAYGSQHDHPVGVHVEAVGKAMATAEQHWHQYVQNGNFDQDQHRQMRDGFSAALQGLVEQGLTPARQALAEARFDDAQVLLLRQINPAMGKAEAMAKTLYDYQERQSRDQMKQSRALRGEVLLWTGMGVLAALLIGIAISLMTVSAINGRLREVVRIFRELAAGNYRNKVDISRSDEIGQVELGLESMQTRLGFDVQEARRVADENLRVRNALDFVSGNIRIADNDGRVIYANRGLLQTLKAIEGPLRESLPGFSVASFVGSSIGVFYENPDEALARLRQLEGTRKTEMNIGGRTYLVITNPIVNDKGEHLGTVGEWVDRTAEIFAQKEVAALIAKAAAGDLEARLDAEALEGFYRELGGSINQLLETSSQAVNEIGALLARMAKGDLSATVHTGYQGSLGRLRDDANATVTQLRELVGRIQESTEAINTAAQEIASGNTDLSSRTEEQASSLEETASSMEELTGTVKVNADSAREANQLADGARRVAER
ncbi:MAG: PAS domain-containing protein, partial [Azovibrio sp.]|uniref:PAS domain-containing protein n=1 Tax=Azovibrio sp. TaxID=1872673 RepID=UPI003C740429